MPTALLDKPVAPAMPPLADLPSPGQVLDISGLISSIYTDAGYTDAGQYHSYNPPVMHPAAYSAIKTKTMQGITATLQYDDEPFGGWDNAQYVYREGFYQESSLRTPDEGLAFLCRRAADLLDQHGWTQGTMRSFATGQMCAFGALRYAGATDLDLHDINRRACQWLNTSTERPATGPWSSVPRWNDQPQRSKEEVTTMLRAVAGTFDQTAGNRGSAYCSCCAERRPSRLAQALQPELAAAGA